MTERYIVGVTKNPDGTLDYSQAASWKKSSREKPTGLLTTQDLAKRKKELDEIWSKSQETQRARASADRAASVGKAEAVYKKLGVESKTEREKSRERAVALVLQDGGVRVHTSIVRELSTNTFSGFQNKVVFYHKAQPTALRIAFFCQMIDHRGQTPDDVLKNHNIREIIDVRHEVKPVYETVNIPGKKGILGIGKTPDRTEQKATGRYEAALHSDQVSDGKKESAVRFTYYVPQGEWRDYSGRRGQMMMADIILPESVAKEIEQILDRDPAVMCKIVERVMKEKLLKDPGAWETPQGQGDSLSPPYGKWDTEPDGGKIYVQKEGVEHGFHENSFRKIMK